MFNSLTAAFILLAFAWATPSFASLSKAQCDRDYDHCKKKHIFDKKPCQKRRDSCFAQLNQQTVVEKKTVTKRRMMNGDSNETTAPSMRNRAQAERMNEAERKTDAIRRLKERQQAKSNPNANMRDNVKSN